MIKKYAIKRFGQNFLNDKNVLEKIANTIDIENKNIIEIGPGKGSLTKLLVKKAKKVIAFEIDYNLVDYLKLEIKESNLEIVNEDFLKTDLSSFNNFSIVSNIPYYISTDIIFKLFENVDRFENVVLLVQKEFAQRLSAKKNTKNYSKLSVTTKLFYEVKCCFDVLPESFYPKPKVISTLILLKPKKNKFDFDVKKFMEFIKDSFAMRRKTLINNLKNKYHIEKLKEALLKLNIPNNVRPENLELEEFILLFKIIIEY